MTKGIIAISGYLDKEPKENKDGSFSLMFKVPHFNEEALNNQESYCLVLVDRQNYGRIKKTIGSDTFCYVKGAFKAGKNQKEVPFITVKSHSIKAVNLPRDEFSSDSAKLTENFPWGTDELMDLSQIKTAEEQTIPDAAKERALAFIMRYGNFERPILVNRDSLYIAEGYDYYLAAQELGIRKVPVSYMKQYLRAGDKDYSNPLKNWYIDEETTSIAVKDIVLKEDVHLKVKHFAFHINLDDYSSNYDKYPPVAVRPGDDGKYILVMGASRYFAAKIMDIEKIPAVIKNMNHTEFVEFIVKKSQEQKKQQSQNTQNKDKEAVTVGTYEIEMSEVTVPDQFAISPPRREKIEEAIGYYKKHNKFDKPIVVKGKKYTITDGYKRYVAAKELGLEKILAKVEA